MKTTTTFQKSVFAKEDLNKTLSDLQIATIKEDTFFIPIVIEINGVRVPSTPFYAKNDNPLFLGDVFEVRFDESTVDTFLVELKNGQYVGTNSDHYTEEPMWLFDMETIINLGSSLKYPELLNRLS